MDSAKIFFRGQGPYTVDELYEAAIVATCEKVQRSSIVVRAILDAVEFRGVLAKAFGDKNSVTEFIQVPKPKAKTKTKKNPEGPESSKDANGPPKKKTRKKRA